jgi:rSAM/selenodomain-associated transferase 2
MKPAARRMSVIIPAVDEQDNIRLLLGDLFPLRREGHELILVDGGSTDSTRAAASGLADRIIVTGRGRALQMNAGASSATGDIFWFLHADSRIAPDAAAAVIRACAEGHVWGRFDVRLSGRHWLLRVIERLMNLRSCISRVATGDQGIFVVRESFAAVGGFPDIPLMEDIAFSKALRRHARPHCIQRPRLTTSSRRWEERGILRTVLLMWRMRLAYALGAAPHRLARLYR